MFSFLRGFPLWSAIGILLAGCSASSPAPQTAPETGRPSTPAAVAPVPEKDPYPVMLGIDVLESQGFAPLKGKNVALLTHAAAVNRNGESTLDILRRAPGVKIVELFGVEHGVSEDKPSGVTYDDYVEKKTGLKVYSLYTGRTDKDGKVGRPTKEQLKGIDVLVIDLQDIGVRSYSFAVGMKHAIEGAFLNDVEVILLDRPNPLGGLKVDGPLLDRALWSGVGAFSVPYVHGLTIGELARMAKEGYAVLEVPEKVRAAGKLTVIPMRGWHRSMRWPDTGLTFQPTSPKIPDYEAVVGYAMIGFGADTALKGFSHSLLVDGRSRFDFRAVNYPNQTPEQTIKALEALRLPGVAYRKVTVKDRAGKDITSVYVDVTDWNSWRPVDVGFHLIQLTLQRSRPNPAATILPTNIFVKSIGSVEFLNAMKRDGARLNVDAFLADWRKKDEIYVQQVKKYWLYD